MDEPASLAARLAARTSPAIIPGLGRTRSLLKLLGNPERGLKVIHVAGTNGKGSVCRMLESVLLAKGLNTGLYTSPHLVRFNERFRVKGAPASDAGLLKAAGPLWRALAIQATRPEGPATYFEAITVLAFLFFRLKRVDVLVLETGLGGRLDSTNVCVHPLMTVITNISLEHTQILGSTEAAIAFEKAGIIKKSSPLVTAAQGRARAVILRRFRRVQGPGSKTACLALRPSRDWKVLSWSEQAEKQFQKVELLHLGSRHSLSLPLLGEHQHENLACCLAVCKILAKPLGLDDAVVAKGLARADWPGRLQVLSRAPLTLADGAHNPAGAKVLAAYVRGLRSRRAFARCAMVAGVLKDKDWKRMFSTWKPWVDRFFLAKPPDERGLGAEELAAWLRARGCRAETRKSLPLALSAARSWAGKRGLVVAAGSLYSMGALLKRRRVR
ncbi:MAG TPA: folylpolyglutamate synthase/dihydrofolate synthase family protein [bacterium]|jgi:dihydrofolate synthase/folylpolyglutamate synthase|nr:folylpolyglutamate synthase/dihydrofolate synthase family protein [bacterium]